MSLHITLSLCLEPTSFTTKLRFPFHLLNFCGILKILLILMCPQVPLQVVTSCKTQSANNTRFCMMLQPFVILETLCTFSWDSTFITGQIMGSFQMSFDIKACRLIRAVVTLDHFGLFSFPVLSLVIVQFLFCTKHFATLVTNLLSFVMSVSVMPQ